jgi:hypothetical protein
MEDGGEPFEGKMERVAQTLASQFEECSGVEETISENLARLGYSLRKGNAP